MSEEPVQPPIPTEQQLSTEQQRPDAELGLVPAPAPSPSLVSESATPSVPTPVGPMLEEGTLTLVAAPAMAAEPGTDPINHEATASTSTTQGHETAPAVPGIGQAQEADPTISSTTHDQETASAVPAIGQDQEPGPAIFNTAQDTQDQEIVPAISDNGHDYEIAPAISSNGQDYEIAPAISSNGQDYEAVPAISNNGQDYEIVPATAAVTWVQQTGPAVPDLMPDQETALAITLTQDEGAGTAMVNDAAQDEGAGVAIGGMAILPGQPPSPVAVDITQYQGIALANADTMQDKETWTDTPEDSIMIDAPADYIEAPGPLDSTASPGPASQASTPIAMQAAVATADVGTIPTEATAHGDSTRRYLNSKVVNPILAGLKMISRTRPRNPIRVLGEYLIEFADKYEK